MGKVSKTFRLKQEDVDIVRLRVFAARVLASIETGNARPPVTHIRFPKPHTRSYRGPSGCNMFHKENRNPPPDSFRHSWERGLNLEIDIGYIEPSLASKVGMALYNAKKVDGRRYLYALAHDIAKRCKAQGYRWYIGDHDAGMTAVEDMKLHKDRTRERRGRMAHSMKRAQFTEKSFASQAIHKAVASVGDTPAGFVKSESGLLVPGK